MHVADASSGQSAHPHVRTGEDRQAHTRGDPLREEQLKKAKLYGGLAVGTVALGAIFKDGLSSGLKRFGGITNNISNVLSVPFSLLFPLLSLDNEAGGLRGEQSKDDLFTRMTYTMASLAFTPNTFGEPVIAATKSKAHMITTLLNLPHILYVFLTYTGGRTAAFITSLKKKFAKDEAMEHRYEQEFEALYKLGNLGSSQASITPLANQFVLGWQTIKDVLIGDFGSAWSRFKYEPISVLLGTCFNSWMFPFDYLAKIFDTTIRTAENVNQFENAFDRKNNVIWKFIINGLEKVRNNWHSASKDQNSATGKFLKFAREASKIEALICPPIGMVSVVTPAFNKFLRGEFWNKEAQDIGGVIGFLDKVFSTGAFVSHLYYTGVYATNVRLPQFATSSIFYICNLINKMKGIDLNDPRLADENYRKEVGYIEPTKIRDKIFEKDSGIIKSISDFGAKWLDYTELILHHHDTPHFINDRWVVDMDNKNRRFIDPATINKDKIVEKTEDKIVYIDSNTGKQTTAIKIKGNGTSRHIRNYSQTMAEEVCYTPVKEAFYRQIMDNEFYDKYIEFGGAPKEKNTKPNDIVWGKLLEWRKEKILQESEKYFRSYLKDSQLLQEDRIEELVRTDYWGEDLPENETSIRTEVEKLLDKEIKAAIRGTSEPKKLAIEGFKSKSWLELLTNPKDLLETLKFRFFHATNTWLPLWIQGFVKVIDYGKEGDPYWKRNIRAQELGIREGDIKQACDREYLPVASFAFQSLGKGLALLYNLSALVFKGQPLPSYNDEH